MSVRIGFLIPLVGVVMGAVAFSACAPVVNTRGNVPDDEKLAQIKPGVHTRQQVAALCGTPSAVATFDDTTWYYINKKTESFAFFRPKVLERQVIAIQFDESGVVKDIRRYNKEHGREIQLVDRVTPSPGKELGIIEQLFGNLGRFEQ